MIDIDSERGRRMYEVRWTMKAGYDMDDLHDDESEAWRMFDLVKEMEGVDSVGIYYVNGDGEERELAVWCRS